MRAGRNNCHSDQRSFPFGEATLTCEVGTMPTVLLVVSKWIGIESWVGDYALRRCRECWWNQEFVTDACTDNECSGNDAARNDFSNEFFSGKRLVAGSYFTLPLRVFVRLLFHQFPLDLDCRQVARFPVKG